MIDQPNQLQQIIPSQDKSLSTQVHEYDDSHRKQVGHILGACLIAQRTYGKQAADIGSLTRIFCNVLNEFPPTEVIQALKTWIVKDPDFPTPYDIKQILAPEVRFDALVYKELCDKRKRGDTLSYREEKYLKAYKDHILRGL